MLVTLNDILPAAQKEHYAVGLFNTVNLEMARGVIAAAEESHSPVIIGTAEVLLPFSGLKELAPLLRSMAEKASVPVVLHFDHGLDAELIRQTIKMGFSSVMYDCSTKSFIDNIRDTKEMVCYAHKQGVSVEAELGHVGANDGSAEGESEDDSSLFTDPLEAKEFADATGVDALAVSIGTAHGAYKKAPKLDFDRLTTIRNTIDTPLVLHGGSGLSNDSFKEVIARGITKVNIFTDINTACAKAAHDGYKEGIGMTDLMPLLTEAVKSATLEKIKLFGSEGRA